MNKPNDLSAKLPIRRVSPDSTTPTMSSGTMRGITVIRMALTQRVPIGSMTVTIRIQPESAVGASAAITSPTLRPRPSPSSTRVVGERVIAILARDPAGKLESGS